MTLEFSWAVLGWYSLLVLIVFTAAMMLWKPANRWMAFQCGAVPGQSLSAYIYELEQAGEWGGERFRPVVDALYSPWQKDHCEWAYKRWLAEGATYSDYLEASFTAAASGAGQATHFTQTGPAVTIRPGGE